MYPVTILIEIDLVYLVVLPLLVLLLLFIVVCGVAFFVDIRLEMLSFGWYFVSVCLSLPQLDCEPTRIEVYNVEFECLEYISGVFDSIFGTLQPHTPQTHDLYVVLNE